MTRFQKGALVLALLLNLSVALLEILAGLWARSVALLADAAHFVEDSAIYLLALLITGSTAAAERRFALAIAVLMMAPGVMAAAQVVRRLADPAPPHAAAVVAVSGLALMANLLGAAIILAARRGPAPEPLGLRAAWYASRHDAMGNIAMIGAGLAVAATGQGWPELVVGVGVALLHLSGAVAILSCVCLRSTRAVR
ncbi:Cation efflux family protein [Gemmobacter megaterium]|uniref:Cation efflux family protein n=1 Tax=Gemmobacter megaterium TaxID=1086013 RepID=A0A1N7KG84_9RHOB|nr:cation transporter [Gemmobacter megaterium]GGE01981.1 hypothetical protein GCM10011345_04040 [Gemmobacter megaterium]SIS60602.1 Cation efflux family protein [Gemmobacter megaterium]